MHWIEPRLVCQVEFTNWTRDHVLRHPSFQGLREDLPATSVKCDAPVPGGLAERGRWPRRGNRVLPDGGPLRRNPTRRVSHARADRAGTDWLHGPAGNVAPGRADLRLCFAPLGDNSFS